MLYLRKSFFVRAKQELDSKAYKKPTTRIPRETEARGEIDQVNGV